MTPQTKLILLDSDVIIHLIKGGCIDVLRQLYPKRLLILDVVLNELYKPPTNTYIEQLLRMKVIQEYVVPKSNYIQIIKEVGRITKENPKIGKGEGYCMAVAKFDDKIIASSNLRDIRQYCQENKITYITTMDILLDAYEAKIMTLAECDFAIYNIKSKGSKLPVSNLSEYINSK